MRFVDLRSLRSHPDFRLFFFGQFLSLIGSWMQGIAQGWLVYRLTQDELTLGAVGFVANIPVLLLGPAAGWIADRFPRRTTVLITHVLSMGQAAMLAYLTLTDRVTVPWIFALAIVFGISNAFEMPSRQSLVGDLVGREDLSNAIALNSSMINVTRIIGPAIAGVVVGFLGEGTCFAVNAFSYIAALITLVMIRVPARPRPLTTRSPLRQILDGFDYVKARRPVSGLLLLLAACSFTSMPYMVLLPVFAKKLGDKPIFGFAAPGGPMALGILQAAAGAGAFVGAITLSRHSGVKGFGRIVVYSGMIAAVALIFFSASPWLPLSALLVAPAGYGLMRLMAATNTLLQSMVSDDMRGRVMSFYSIMLVGMYPFGSLAAGTAAKFIGAPITVALFGSAGLTVSFFALLWLPRVAVEANALLTAAGALPTDPSSAQVADVSVPAVGTPAGARSDIHHP